MDFFVTIIIIGVFALFLFIATAMSSLKYRAKQHILKGTGISSSDVSAGLTGSFEQKHLQDFLTEHQNFTEESIKDLLKQYAIQIFNRNSINEFSQAVYEKMQKDSKLEKMQNMEYRRTNIIYYKNSRLEAIVVFADHKDEYNVYLSCTILGDRIQIETYRITKGAVIGF